jgi:simple sugar transport system substrate-binding protein
MKKNRVLAVFALVAVGLLTAAGCSSSGGKQAQEDNSAVAAGQADTPRLKIAMIHHAPPGDTFWDIIRKGAEAAAAKDNVELVFVGNIQAPEQANLVQNAIDQKVDGIAVTMPNPDALGPVVKKAQDAGIPVVGFNAGVDQWKQLGLLSFFGQDEKVAGQAFGNRLNETGAKHAACVIQEQGQVQLEARCAGVKETFKGATETLYVNGQDMPSVQSTIQAKLQQDSSIDYVVTLGAPFALAAVKSVKDAGSAAKIATFDTNKELVAAVKDGTIQFAVDQQPFLQGYLAIDTLWLYKTNGNYPGGGQEPVLTGPAFVTKDNVDAVAEFASRGTR